MTAIQFGIRLTADGAQAAGEMARFGRSVGDVRDELDAATAAAASHGGAVKSLTGVVAGYAAAAASAFGVSKLAAAADEWGQLASRLDIAAGSADAAAEATDRLMAVSNRTYKSFANSAELYIRTGDSLAELGISAEQALGMVEALQYGLTVSSADQERSARVIDAWSKAILNGKMGLEEYQTVVAAAPRLQKALADSLGVTNAELQQMVSDGKITADVLVGVSSQVQRLGEEADRMPVTLADSFQRLDNQITRFAGNAEANVGVIRAVTSGVTALGDNLELVAAAAGVAGVAALGRYTGALTTTAVAKARTALETQKALAVEVAHQQALARSAAASAQAALGANAVAAARQREAAATEAAAIAQGRMITGTRLAGGAMRALGGPIGVAITLLGVAAIAWQTFGERAAEGARRAGESAEWAKKKLQELQNQDRYGAGDLGEANQRLEKARRLLSSYESVANLTASGKATKAKLEEEIAGLEAYIERLQSGPGTAQEKANARYATYLADRRSLSEQLRTDLETELQAFTAATRGIEQDSAAYAAALEAYNRKTAEIRARYAKKDGNKARDKDLNAGFDTAAAGAYASAMDALVRIQREAGAEGQTLTRSQLALRELMLSPEWGRMPEPWRQVVEEMARTGDEAERAGEKAARLSAMLAETDSAKLERTREDMLLLVQAMEQGVDVGGKLVKISAQTFSEAATARLGLVADEGKNQLDELQRAVEGWGRSSAQALADFATGGKASFRDFARSVIRDMVEMMAYQALVKPLMGAVGGAVMGFLGGGAAAAYGTTAGSQQTAMLAAQDSWFGGFRANGGSVAAGKTYVVGERGPELLTMGAGGYVTPNHALGGGDTFVSISVHADGSSRQESASPGTEQMELGRRLEAAVRTVIVAEKRPGGLLAGGA